MGLFFLGFGPLGSNWQHAARDQPWVQFYFQVDLGTGAAVGGMQLEINTGYSCYLTAARRRRGVFFPSGSGPRGSGWRYADKDEHWVQLLFASFGQMIFRYWVG